MVRFSKKQIFLVVGASSGIGKGATLQLNELGATVIAVARNEERLNAMKAKAKLSDNIHIEVKDIVDDIEALPDYVGSLKIKYGQLQGMVYCAGCEEIRPMKLLNLVDMKTLFNVNLHAPVFLAKGLITKKKHVENSVSMVFISSVAAFISDRGMIAYAGSKAALSASIKSMGRELAPYGIRVNCISPSDINTPMTERSQGDSERFKKYPMGIGRISDVTNLIMFLLSDKSKRITAQDYVVDCGRY